MEPSLLKEMCLTVRDEYLKALPTMPVEKRFHFLSRAYLWTGKGSYYDALVTLREEWWKKFERVERSLTRVAEGRYTPPKRGKKYREPYKSKYGPMWAYNRFFFMCLFDETIFKGDAWSTHHSLINEEHLCTLHTALTADLEAVHTLSTLALNFCTLSAHFFPGRVPPVSTEYVLRVGEHPRALSDEDNLDAVIYLYTHAIIGKTLFYAEALPPESREEHIRLLTRVETLLQNHCASASLDHKCEFLVCAELCGYATPLRARISEELSMSLAPQGTHFINIHNTHHTGGSTKSMARMEHTNILALMAVLGRKGL